MSRETIIKCDICGSNHNVKIFKLPMYRTFDATDGKTYYKSPQIVLEDIDICAECLSKCTNIHDKRVQGYGDIVIKKNPIFKIMTTKEQREIIEAYERGEEIEYRLTNESRWFNLNKTLHDFNFQRFTYRIKRWRAEKDGTYYFVNACMEICEWIDTCCHVDDEHYKFDNYFRTREEAEKARDLLIKTLTKFHEND